MMVVQRRRELAGRSSAKRGENSVSHDAISADRRCKRPRITNRRTNLAEEIEQSRRLPLALVENMARVGLFRLRVPRAIGGEETDPMTLVRVVEEISRADGAARWSVALSGEYGIFGGLLPEASAREIYGSDPDVRTAGTLRASGTARVIEGGYRVTGRWQLGSGCQHSKWLVGGCQIMDGNEPRLRPNGSPVTRILFVPADECEIIDTWHSIGLRGTGSHDYAVADVFVPADHSFSFREPPVDPGPLYAMPTIALFCTALAAVSLGSLVTPSTFCWTLRRPGPLRDHEEERCGRTPRRRHTSGNPKPCCVQDAPSFMRRWTRHGRSSSRDGHSAHCNAPCYGYRQLTPRTQPRRQRS
jgi:hypothetical protein